MLIDRNQWSQQCHYTQIVYLFKCNTYVYKGLFQNLRTYMQNNLKTRLRIKHFQIPVSLTYQRTHLFHLIIKQAINTKYDCFSSFFYSFKAIKVTLTMQATTGLVCKRTFCPQWFPCMKITHPQEALACFVTLRFLFFFFFHFLPLIAINNFVYME